MDAEWHWHTFYRALSEDSLGSAILASLFERHCIWISQPKSPSEYQEFDAQPTVAKVKAYVDSLPSDEWVDVVLGVRHSKDECLRLQDEIVTKLIDPLKKGYELYEVVRDADRSRR
jgi:hypothetical protein